MSGIAILCGIVMFIALAGMVACSKKQKTSPAAQPIAIALLIVVVASGIGLMMEMGVFGSDSAKLWENENRFYASQGYVVGEFLGKNAAGKKVLVLCEPNFAQDKRVKLLEQALKDGGVKGAIVFATPELSKKPKSANPNDPGMDMPLFEVMVAQDFDNIMDKNKDCGVIISTIGLPRDAQNMKFWTMPAKTRPNLVLIGSAEMRGLGAAIERGLVDAVVTVSPKAKFTEDPAPKDMKKAFDVRYVLVTKANIKDNKKLFAN